MSTFSGLNTATTALWAQRRGLDVTGQNIANVNTEGYSRQRAELRAEGGNAVAAFYSVSNSVGSGVSADEVLRIRDTFLEGRAHVERASSQLLTAQNDAYKAIEQAFREPGDTGLQSVMSEMWAGWDDVVNAPDDLAARSQLLQRLDTLAGGLRSTHAALDKQWGQTQENLDALVEDVNSATTAIAKLNQSVRLAELSGLPSNELADQRDLLIVGLAEKIGATTMPTKDGGLNVVVGGLTLVAGDSAMRLTLAKAATADDASATSPSIVTDPGGVTVQVGGKAGGQLSALREILPGYRDELDGIAVQLATELNTAHALGVDLAGVAGKSLLGHPTEPLSAGNIRLMISDPREIAASAAAVGTTTFDGGNADRISQIRLGAEGPDANYRAAIVELGVQSAVAGRRLEIQAVVTNQVDSARESVAGVNLDEEMSNMLQFQHAYSAAARMVTAIDEALDVLINRTGVVGR
ncbi:flagellar hook-associated protein FlgK [Geodermatophilus sabuli]|uniref:Flagellar hook-associated protein 1 n=1 Tax=Geodermatophilus sabuli TaxID=1564158 RepID=A0A285EJC3_9ACTN|nr:flagellar hook-associated protein FlgK [Geodermatophilus sabuli]MBB3083140.1 flagellar hook-associated protein 1 FlgK [Geodermatophilus sabuli]SNX98136.1 flagellar hook-associated protein 1 FlgK [Geodermatophilus sabuli]